MNLTNGQKAALEAIESLQKDFPNGKGLCIISGYSGTGKSTMLRVVGEEDDILVLAPTGKATLRVKELGVKNCMTIHRWLYKPIENPKTGEVFFATKDGEDFETPPNRTIFIDEASMLTEKMFRDLWKAASNCGLNLVFVGDPFQLPPVEMDIAKKEFSIFKMPSHYRVDMTEVVRQALDSPIIRASMQVRDFRAGLDCLGTDIPVIMRRDVIPECIQNFNNDGVVICHRNVTRHSINDQIREALGKDPEKPELGEPLLVLFNNYEIDAYNGEVLSFDSTPRLAVAKAVPVTDRQKNASLPMFFYQTSVNTATGTHKVLFADRELFGKNGEVSMKAIRHAGRDLSTNIKVKELTEASGGYVSPSERDGVKPDPVVNANFGYTLTAFKAQGSEWQSALVLLEDTIKPYSEFGRRFIYTSITRAKTSVKICWL